MKCSLIRDLLPLFVEGDCSTQTNQMVKEHLESCSACCEIYEAMKSPIDLKGIDQPVAIETQDKSSELWKRYYGRLILKGIGIFFIAYTGVVTLMVFLK